MSVLAFTCMVGAAALVAAPHLSRDSRLVRQLVIGFSLIVTLRYVFWRVTSTLPPWELSALTFLAYVLLGIELIAVYLQLDDYKSLKQRTQRSEQVERQLDWYGDRPPPVDIMIPTYNEVWEVLEKTLVGATSQTYPNCRVWLLDDGRRDWLREKAAEWGVGYLTRSDNAHYKAGNLNTALETLKRQGVTLEFIAVLDADFVARPEFVRRTMALMKEPDVGIAQTPQFFYNPDPFQVAFGGIERWPDEQRTWFDFYLPSWDALGRATCCGTSFLMRVAALESIGGFPTESVSEDTLASLKVARNGYRTVYLTERLTMGLAAEGVGEFLVQRARWLLGGIQIIRYFGPGAGLRARLRYWALLWRMAIFGVARSMWLLVFIVYWFTGEWLLQVHSMDEVLSFVAPMYLDVLFQGWLFGGRRMLLVQDAQKLLIAPMWVMETIHAVLGTKKRFVVTDKAVRRDRLQVRWGLIKVQLFIGATLVAALLYNLIDPSAPLYAKGLLQPATAGTALLLCALLAALLPAVEGPQRRAADRYPTDERVIALANGARFEWRCTEISIDGVRVALESAIEPPSRVQLSIDHVGHVDAHLVRQHGKGAVYAFERGPARHALIRKVYCSDTYVPSPARWGLRGVWGAFFHRLLA